MSKLKTIAAGVVGLSMVFALGVAVTGVSVAQAQTVAFSRDLTVGSTGADVTALQTVLVAQGHLVMPSGVAMGYFGTLTRTAVAKWQAAVGISPAAGYVGPVSRAYLNSHMGGGTTGGTFLPGCTSNTGFSTTTGMSCAGGTNLPAGCTSTMGYSPTTGVKCDGTTGGGNNNGGGLTGGAGSINDADFISSLNNEEVGEDDEDVQIAGLEIEVDDGSDIEITAVTLDFSQGTATNDDFDEFATEVSIWLDGEEVARVDAGDFEENDSWTQTISLDNGAVIAADEVGELVVALSGVSNLDSDDESDTWNVEFEAVRFRDADGATVTENSTGDINGVTRTFSFETFAASADTELVVSESDDAINDAHIINVDDSDDTDDEDLLSFSLEAEGDSDLVIDEIPVNFDVTGASHVDDLVSTVTLFADGEEIGSENMGTDVGTDETITFDDLDFTIGAGETVEFLVKADFNATDTDLDEGDTISAQISATERALIDAEDGSGEELATGDMTGTATGDPHAVFDKGIIVTLVSTDERTVSESTGADNDAGQFTIKYRVEAFDGDVYVSDSSTATTDVSEDGIEETTLPSSGGVVYVLDEAGTATTADASAVVTFSKVSGTVTDSGITNGVKINDGSVAEFTLTVTRSNSGDSEDDGTYRVLLDAIGWAITDTSTMNVFDFDLNDFKTDPLYIN